MSEDRCFSNPNKYESSSDHTRITKQKTIYKDVVNQVQTQTNFIKSNGVNYNKNFGLHNNCLAFAKSYDLLLDVTKGKYYTTPVEDPNWISNEAWSAGLYSVDYSANNVNVVVDTSYNAGNGNHIIFPITRPAELADISWNGVYPGVRVDPSYNIFYNECEDENYWREKLVDMSFNNTNYYSQSKQQSEKLYGMYYPGNITFSCGNEKKVGGLFITAVDYDGYIYISSDYGVTWTPTESIRLWWRIAMSADGKYQTAITSNEKIYVSSDYGATWTPKDSNRQWRGIAMSADGKYQSAVDNNNGYIYISSDYGATWAQTESNRAWWAIAMSSDGSKQTAVVDNGRIYISSNYGATWAPTESNRFWHGIAMSADGKYQTAITSNEKIYVSSDYGVTWVPKDSNRQWWSITMSADGKYQSAVDNNNGYIYISSDYGATWAPKNYTSAWLDIAMSADGSKQAAVSSNTNINISSDYGATWSQTEPIRNWNGIAMSS